MFMNMQLIAIVGWLLCGAFSAYLLSKTEKWITLPIILSIFITTVGGVISLVITLWLHKEIRFRNPWYNNDEEEV